MPSIKYDTTKDKIRYWSLIILLVIFLSFSIYAFVYFKLEAKHAEENPFVYAAQRANADSCECVVGNQTLKFNQERAWIEIIRTPQDAYILDEINWSFK